MYYSLPLPPLPFSSYDVFTGHVHHYNSKSSNHPLVPPFLFSFVQFRMNLKRSLSDSQIKRDFHDTETFPICKNLYIRFSAVKERVVYGKRRFISLYRFTKVRNLHPSFLFTGNTGTYSIV